MIWVRTSASVRWRLSETVGVSAFSPEEELGMKLNKEEQDMLDGKQGSTLQR
jgi:hypothetical protein